MYNIVPLPGPNSSESLAFGLSQDGGVSGVAYEPIIDAGVIWLGGSFDFSLDPGSYSTLYAVNSSGDAVGVRAADNSDTEIAVLVRSDVVHDLTPSVGNGSIATGINESGLICGWSWNNPKAFVYDSVAGKVIHSIDPLPSQTMSVATAISAAGNVAGRSGNNGYFYDGAVKDLGPAAFISSMNDSNLIAGSIGKAYPQNFAPAIWDANQPAPAVTELPVPAGFTGGHGEGINNKGDVVGSCWNTATYNGKQSAYLYSGGVSTDLNTLILDPDWHLESAEQINDKGQIAGFGTYNGQTTAFLMRPQTRSLVPHLTLPELVGILIGGVAVDGGGWIRVGGIPIPVDPWGPWLGLNAAKRDVLIALAMDEMAMYISERATREEVRAALLQAVQSSLNRLKGSVAERRTSPGGAVRGARVKHAMKSGKVEVSARRFR